MSADPLEGAYRGALVRNAFPPGFEFGVATSAFQIEGATDRDGRGPSIWDPVSPPGMVATDHYGRLDEDVRLLVGLGADSYRFSFSWPRILPDGVGAPNLAGLAFYDRLLDRLLAAGILPVATMYHWDLPQRLEDRGGWRTRDIANWFADYAVLLVERFGDRVARWATLNEPIALWVGYGTSLFPPGLTDPKAGRTAMHHALLAHGTAIQAIRSAAPAAELGIVIDIWPRHPATETDNDRRLARREEDDSFRFFLAPLFGDGYDPATLDRYRAAGTLPDVREGDLETISQPLDFLGINVYNRVVVGEGGTRAVGGGGNFLDNGTEFYPRALHEAVFAAIRDYKVDVPIYITENGSWSDREPERASKVDDEYRIRYVDGFLRWLLRAVDDGADIRGYALWTLVDNVEWTAGFSQRYGLVHLDTATLARTPKASYQWYRALLRS